METQSLELTTNVAANAAPLMLAGGMMGLILVLAVREMIRKGIALRKAGTQKRLTRFICLFIFNTIGILPIIYLAFFQKKKKNK